jgi:NAD(P)-dependent dehydrogenase (short-subunit alcohol dehydrogenase family)
MRADTLTDTFTALRELPRAVLHSVAPAVPRPVRHALRSGQRAMQLSQRVAWYSLLSALVLLAPPSRAQSADTDSAKAESPYFFVKGAQPGVDALPLKSTDVQVHISGVIADVVVTQRYKNEGAVPIEARYIVPGSTKAAVISLTQSTALNLIKHRINVNAIAPGVVDGEHWAHVDSMFAKLEGKAPGQKKAEVGASVPFGRMGTAEDLTGMAIFLASPEADYIVAQTYNVDGGNWMS